MGKMGWRALEVTEVDKEDATIVEFTEQFVAFCTHFGFVPDDQSTGSTLSFVLDGNSSLLDEFTTFLVSEVETIRTDIDPDHAGIARVAETIIHQLVSQIVDHQGGGITAGRKWREIQERFNGEGSFGELAADLDVHTVRLKENIRSHETATGPTAWKQRMQIHRLVRLDAKASISTARKIHRIGSDLQNRLLPSDHLTSSLASFEAQAIGFIALRDIDEHHDEYVIGAGRRDPNGTQPGSVFDWDIGDGDVKVSARGHSIMVLALAGHVHALIRCLQSATEHHESHELAKGMLNPDFMEKTPDGSWNMITRENETDDHRSVRESMEKLRKPDVPKAPPLCEECDLPI